ncbi:MAG: MFS transporter [Planctomyces sp.]|jgi:ACS family D-galactonate transporter-like MFS transporter|nr:MFS transporter [Planctomyces sp.]
MRYQILALFFLMAGIAYVQRAAISVPAEQVAKDLAISNFGNSMGFVQSAWYLGYALLQIPAGRLADRWGSRSAILLYCILWSLATTLTGFSSGLWTLTSAWFLMGALQAGAFPCAAQAIGQIFPLSERARASGILAAGMAVGGAAAPAIVGRLLIALQPTAASNNLFTWQLLLFLLAIPGILWSLLFAFSVPKRHLPARHTTADTIPLTTMFRKMLTSGPLALLCAQQFLRAAGMVFFLSWFPTFLQKTRGLDLKASADFASIAGIGGVVGSLSGGWASDLLLKITGNPRLSRQGVAVVGMTLCSLLMLASVAVSSTWLSIGLISAGVFCATFGGVSGYTVAIEFGGRQTATVFSMMNMVGNFGAMLFPWSAGWLADRFSNWNLMILFFCGIMAIDAVCWALLNPRAPLFPDPPPESPT